MPPESIRPTSLRRRRDLLAEGWTDRQLARAVVDGHLLKPRPNAYLLPDAPSDVVDACRLGGRLGCVSELARLGVFVLELDGLHVHLHDNRASAPTIARRTVRHWDRLRRTPAPRATSVESFDALVQATRCQAPRAALATLDSALHLGVLRADDLDELFGALPRRHRVLRRLVDMRAEAGTAAAALGYATYRPIAEDILWHPEDVRAALAGLLAVRAARAR